MSELKVVRFGFDDVNTLFSASETMGKVADLPIMADYAKLCLVLPGEKADVATRLLSEASFEVSFVEVAEADEDEHMMFSHLDDPKVVETDYDGTYVHAWGGIMV